MHKEFLGDDLASELGQLELMLAWRQLRSSESTKKPHEALRTEWDVIDRCEYKRPVRKPRMVRITRMFSRVAYTSDLHFVSNKKPDHVGGDEKVQNPYLFSLKRSINS